MNREAFLCKEILSLVSKFASTSLLALIAFILIPISDAYAQDECPSELNSVIYTFSSYNLLLDSGGYQMHIPLDWESTVIDGQRTFYPCENQNVKMQVGRITGVDFSFSTEQLANSYIERYAKNIDGYRVIGSEYIDGTQDFSVVATAGDSESPTIWHGFIPINGRTGPELFVITFSAGSPDSYEKYGGIARFIFDNIKTVTESQTNQYLSMIGDRNKMLADNDKFVADARQNMWDNMLGHLQKQTELDAKYNVEKGKYDNCQPSELGRNPSC